jgi:dipeptidyl aminopeptidase/acylaminoacyl peptidase
MFAPAGLRFTSFASLMVLITAAGRLPAANNTNAGELVPARSEVGSSRTYALEVLSVATGNRRVIFRAPVKMDSPHFSADGSALYFNREGRIERVTRTGPGVPVVVDTGFATHCINDHGISPDGAQLVISDLTESGKSRMYVLPVSGGTPRRIDVPEPALWHGWSPDGQTLAYGAQREGDYDVYTVPVAGGPETRLTTAPGNDNGPDYSADGRWIYFHSVRSGRFQIWRMHADGSKQEQVTNDEFFNWFPHPSPDGKWIAILSSKVVPDTGHPPDGEYVLRLLSTTGGAPRELARFFAGNGSFNVPCWSRDSAQLAFASYEPGL